MQHKGVNLSLSFSGFAGDVALEVLYPDPVEAQRACGHAAVVNGRPQPYPLDAFGYALAIQHTLVCGAGAEKPDLTTVLAVYDADPVLWQKLCGAALEVLGLLEEADGQMAWTQVHALLFEGLRLSDWTSVRQALGLAASALAGHSSAQGEVSLNDPLLDSALGN